MLYSVLEDLGVRPRSIREQEEHKPVLDQKNIIQKVSHYRALFLLTLGFAVSVLILTKPMMSVAKTPAPLKLYTYEIVEKYKHDTNAFTQGLIYKDGFIYESTGLPGRSTVRQVDLETGDVLQNIPLKGKLYGEGLTIRGDDLILLTWKAGTGFVLDPSDLSTKSTFNYPGEGWGAASSPNHIYMSDGSAFIRIIDPKTLEEESRFEVTLNGKPIKLINELEWIDGELWANIWKSDLIVKIDPVSGEITAIINLADLLSEEEKILKDEPAWLKGENVLNGIAYDAESKRLFVTGKFWPYMFEIKLVEK